MLTWAISLLVTFAPPDSATTSQPPAGEEESPELEAEIEASPAGQAEGSPPGESVVSPPGEIEDSPSSATGFAAPGEAGFGAPGQASPGADPALEPGKLLLVPATLSHYRIIGSEVDLTVTAGADQPVMAELPAGVYQIYDAAGEVVAAVVITAGQTQVWDGEASMPLDVWARRTQPGDPSMQAGQIAPAPYPIRHRHKHNWRAWVSPLSSALVPGVGQFINGQPGKATGILFGSIAAIVGSSALYKLGNYGQRSDGAEYARLVGYGALSTAIPMLWVYAVADAYRVALGEHVDPLIEHQVRLSLTRTMTVGLRADPSGPGFYDDWGLAIMGQVVPRLSLGISDLGVKFGGSMGPQVWQFGLRIDYRVLERPRLWLNVGLGTAMQIAAGKDFQPLDPDAPIPYQRAQFGAIPYAVFDMRWFILDRLSLDFTPRLSVPVTTRYFSSNRALPRFAPSLEFAAGVSVYF